MNRQMQDAVLLQPRILERAFGCRVSNERIYAAEVLRDCTALPPCEGQPSELHAMLQRCAPRECYPGRSEGRIGKRQCSSADLAHAVLPPMQPQRR
jgi:hypothetical protein